MIEAGKTDDAPNVDWKTIPQGAATSVWAAVTAPAELVGGRYCQDCHTDEIDDSADIRFGVLKGTDGAVLLFKPGYKVGIARHDRRSFDILQPHYGPNDPNCCPKSFREQRFTWNGTRFKGGPLQKLKTAPRRFWPLRELRSIALWKVA